MNKRENRIATAVEFAKGEVWPMECFNDHYEFVNDCEYLLGRVRKLEASVRNWEVWANNLALREDTL